MKSNNKLKNLHPKAVWLFFFRFAGGLIFAAILISIWSVPLVLSGEGRVMKFFSLIPLFSFLFLIFLIYVWARLSWRFWRYQLIEDSYRSERGVIFKRYVSIPYERIQNVDIYRGILDRILGLSDLQIHTAGYGAAGRGGTRGFGSEGRLPGLSMKEAEKIRDELIKRAKGNSGV